MTGLPPRPDALAQADRQYRLAKTLHAAAVERGGDADMLSHLFAQVTDRRRRMQAIELQAHRDRRYRPTSKPRVTR